MSKTYTYNYCPVNGVTVATIEDKKNNIIVIGKAFCHPKDRDYCSELTGTHIAHQRAEIKYCATKGNLIFGIDNTMELFLENIKENISYDRWYFGHFHEDLKCEDNAYCLFEYILPFWN